MLIGITGPSGAGKGCAARVFARHGFAVIDADKIAREVVSPGQPALTHLADRFGEDIIFPDGTLNRKLLSQRAFSSREETHALNGIMHGEICSRMKSLAEQYRKDGRNCLFDAPLLIEAGLTELCDVCIAVISPQNVRVARLKERDGLSEQDILNRISRQHNDDYYTSHCEYIIVNDGDIRQLEERAEAIVHILLSSAEQ